MVNTNIAEVLPLLFFSPPNHMRTRNITMHSNMGMHQAVITKTLESMKGVVMFSSLIYQRCWCLYCKWSSRVEVEGIVEEVDEDSSGTVDFDELLAMNDDRIDICLRICFEWLCLMFVRYWEVLFFWISQQLKDPYWAEFLSLVLGRKITFPDVGFDRVATSPFQSQGKLFCLPTITIKHLSSPSPT